MMHLVHFCSHHWKGFVFPTGEAGERAEAECWGGEAGGGESQREGDRTQSSGEIQRVAAKEKPRETGEGKEGQSNRFSYFPPSIVTHPSSFLTYSASGATVFMSDSCFVLYFFFCEAESLMIWFGIWMTWRCYLGESCNEMSTLSWQEEADRKEEQERERRQTAEARFQQWLASSNAKTRASPNSKSPSHPKSETDLLGASTETWSVFF